MKFLSLIIFLAIAAFIAYLAFKILGFLFKKLWFLIVFVASLITLIVIQVFLDFTSIGLAIGIISALSSAWAFAKRKS